MTAKQPGEQAAEVLRDMQALWRAQQEQLPVVLEAAARRAGSLCDTAARRVPPRGARAEVARIRKAIRLLVPDARARARLLALCEGSSAALEREARR